MKYLSFLLLFLCQALFSFAQQSQETLIKEIRRKYVTLHEQLPTPDSVQKDIQITTEGGKLTGFYKNKELIALKVSLYGETFRHEEEYYLEGGQPFFVLYIHHTYNRPAIYDQQSAKTNKDTEAFDPRKTQIEENRFYLANQKLIRWIDANRKSVSAASPKFQQQNKSLFKSLKEYQELLKNS